VSTLRRRFALVVLSAQTPEVGDVVGAAQVHRNDVIDAGRRARAPRELADGSRLPDPDYAIAIWGNKLTFQETGWQKDLLSTGSEPPPSRGCGGFEAYDPKRDVAAELSLD
jgi:hypothetical protein